MSVIPDQRHVVSAQMILNVDDYAPARYPALHRLERRGWIKARWGTSENNRRAKYYELTRAGRKQLETEMRLFMEEIDWIYWGSFKELLTPGCRIGKGLDTPLDSALRSRELLAFVLN